MPETRPQSYQDHVRRLPPLYWAAILAALVALLAIGWRLVRAPGLDAVTDLALLVAVAGAIYFARISPRTVQDRVIRLEERLRLERLLPAELRERVPELTVGQLAALRFAGDGEVAALVADVLAGRLASRDEIKRRVRDWRPDHLRV
jgi:hypothetical protein